MPSLVLITEGVPRQIFPLGKSTVMVGRSDESAIHLPSGNVSREHAAVVYEDGHFILRDGGSTNGTFINGVKVSGQVLNDHDILRFGEYLFLVDLQDQRGQGIAGQPALQAKEVKVSGAGSDYRAVVKIRTGAIPQVKRASAPQVPPKEDMTLMLTEPVTVQPASSTAPTAVWHGRPDYSRTIFACGCVGMLTFLPAIVLGYLSHDGTPQSRIFRRLGMAMAYVWLMIWIAVAIWFLDPWGSGNEPVAVEASVRPKPVITVPEALKPPVVADGMALLRGPVTWSPSVEFLDAMVSTAKGPELFTLPPGSPAGIERGTLFQHFRGNWKAGLVAYEPVILRAAVSPEAPERMDFILEDVTIHPTFQGLNSTMVPGKKCVLGPFYVPGLGENLFHRTNPRLASKIAKFNEDRFPWHMAERGVSWKMEEKIEPAKDYPQLRWLCLLRPSLTKAPLVLHTLEGDLLKDVPAEHALALYPAEIIAEVLYNQTTQTPLSVRLNPRLFKASDLAAARSLIESNLRLIQAHHPASETDIPLAFRLKPPTAG